MGTNPVVGQWSVNSPRLGFRRLREDRPAVLNGKLTTLLFEHAKVTAVPACDRNTPDDADQKAAFALMTKPGMNVCVIETQPYGQNGVRAQHFFMNDDGDEPCASKAIPS